MARRERDDGFNKRDFVDHLKGVVEIDYKDAELLKKFMTERGKILPRRYTGATAKQQRQIKGAVRRARVMGLLR
ncbi:MAG: 30S ribosomal protein S18 [Kiritimatiellales bacterium]|nr:30S ribosomal protein S18 [Kiritimatiellales bacterium]